MRVMLLDQNTLLIKKYKVGSCAHVDLSTFSFHALKTITTGEGGAVTTNNKVIFERLKKF